MCKQIGWGQRKVICRNAKGSRTLHPLALLGLDLSPPEILSMISEFLFPMIFSSGVKICDAAFEATAGPCYINTTVPRDLGFPASSYFCSTIPFRAEIPWRFASWSAMPCHGHLSLTGPDGSCWALFHTDNWLNPGQCTAPYFPCCPVGLLGPCGSEAYDLGRSLLYILSHVVANWS